MSRELRAELRHAERMAQDQTNPGAERALWRALAEEIRTYLAEPPTAVDLFGQAATEPSTPAPEEKEET